MSNANQPRSQGNKNVIKDRIDRYQINKNGECASICIDEWECSHPSGEVYYCGEILINSSFGSYANTWTSCHIPFKQFVAGLSFEYFMSKCLGTKLHVYDGDKTFKYFLKEILLRRRNHNIDKEEAREAWNSLSNIEDNCLLSSDMMTTEMIDIQSSLPTRLQEIVDEPWHRICTKYDAQAVGFWRNVWPEFVTALNHEEILN